MTDAFCHSSGPNPFASVPSSLKPLSPNQKVPVSPNPFAPSTSEPTITASCPGDLTSVEDLPFLCEPNGVPGQFFLAVQTDGTPTIRFVACACELPIPDVPPTLPEVSLLRPVSPEFAGLSTLLRFSTWEKLGVWESVPVSLLSTAAFVCGFNIAGLTPEYIEAFAFDTPTPSFDLNSPTESVASCLLAIAFALDVDETQDTSIPVKAVEEVLLEAVKELREYGFESLQADELQIVNTLAPQWRSSSGDLLETARSILCLEA